MSKPSPTSSSKFSVARVGALSIPVLLIAVLSYQMSIANLPKPDVNAARAIAGMGRPVDNNLAAGYTDADGDLVADRPADAARLIDPDTLVFSYVAEESPAAGANAQLWVSFTEHLATVTGKTVVYRAYSDREAQLRAIRDGELHITGLNTGNVPFAVNAAGFVPCVTVATDDGKNYSMKIIVPADSSIKTVKDLKGNTLTLTKRSSNSGFKAPLLTLSADFNMELHRDFNVVHSFGHEQSIVGILKGEYTAAAVASDLIGPVAAAHKLDPAKARAIYESPPFPRAVIGYAHNLTAELAEKIDKAIESFEFTDEKLRLSFAAEGGVNFAAVNYAEDFAHVRRIDDAFGTEHRLD